MVLPLCNHIICLLYGAARRKCSKREIQKAARDTKAAASRALSLRVCRFSRLAPLLAPDMTSAGRERPPPANQPRPLLSRVALERKGGGHDAPQTLWSPARSFPNAGLCAFIEPMARLSAAATLEVVTSIAPLSVQSRTEGGCPRWQAVQSPSRHNKRVRRFGRHGRRPGGEILVPEIQQAAAENAVHCMAGGVNSAQLTRRAARGAAWHPLFPANIRFRRSTTPVTHSSTRAYDQRTQTIYHISQVFTPTLSVEAHSPADVRAAYLPGSWPVIPGITWLLYARRDLGEAPQPDSDRAHAAKGGAGRSIARLCSLLLSGWPNGLIDRPIGRETGGCCAIRFSANTSARASVKTATPAHSLAHGRRSLKASAHA